MKIFFALLVKITQQCKVTYDDPLTNFVIKIFQS